MKNETQIRHNFIDLTLIQVGGFLCPPAVMLGFILSMNYGISTAALSIMLGNIILALLAIPIGMSASKTRKPTIEYVKQIAGNLGAKIAAAGSLLVMAGWFAINLNLTSESLLSSFAHGQASEMRISLNLLIGILIMLAVSRGIEFLKHLSKLTVPLFVVAMGCTFAILLSRNSIDYAAIETPKIALSAILLVVAGAFSMIFDLPTYFRFAQSKKDSTISIIIIFVIAMSIVEMLGVVFYLLSPANSLVEMLTSTGGILLICFNTLFLTVAGFTTNNGNLYVSSINISALLPGIPHNSRILIAGIISIALSLMDVLAHYETLLQTVLVILACITALIFIHALLQRLAINHVIALTSVCFGISVGLCSSLQIVHFIDSAYIEAALMTAICYGVITSAKQIMCKGA
jgi:purine-cytosine permease-like protein